MWRWLETGPENVPNSLVGTDHVNRRKGKHSVKYWVSFLVTATSSNYWRNCLGFVELYLWEACFPKKGRCNPFRLAEHFCQSSFFLQTLLIIHRKEAGRIFFFSYGSSPVDILVRGCSRRWEGEGQSRQWRRLSSAKPWCWSPWGHRSVLPCSLAWSWCEASWSLVTRLPFFSNGRKFSFFLFFFFSCTQRRKKPENMSPDVFWKLFSCYSRNPLTQLDPGGKRFFYPCN